MWTPAASGSGVLCEYVARWPARIAAKNHERWSRNNVFDERRFSKAAQDPFPFPPVVFFVTVERIADSKNFRLWTGRSSDSFVRRDYAKELAKQHETRKRRKKRNALPIFEPVNVLSFFVETNEKKRKEDRKEAWKNEEGGKEGEKGEERWR